MSPALPTAEEIRAQLEALRAERGFLLPHHGAMIAAAPDLAAAYRAMYRALTLTERHLTPFEKEFVWLAVLIAAREAIGTHHLGLFFAAGGTEAQAETALRLAGHAASGDSYAFVDRHWADRFSSCAGVDAYHAATDALLAGCEVARGAAELALAAAQAARGFEWGIAAHVERAYREGVPEPKLVEALSLVMWPCGVNRFLEACAVWHRLMGEGRVEPSPEFRAWAETPAQGGYDDRSAD